MRLKNLIFILILGSSYSCAKDDNGDRSSPVSRVPKEIIGTWAHSSPFFRPLLGTDGMEPEDDLYRVKVKTVIEENSIGQLITFEKVADNEEDGTSPTLVTLYLARTGFPQVDSLAGEKTELTAKWDRYFCLDERGPFTDVSTTGLDQALRETKLSLKVKEDSLDGKIDELRESTWMRSEPMPAAPEGSFFVGCSQLLEYKAEFDKVFTY